MPSFRICRTKNYVAFREYRESKKSCVLCECREFPKKERVVSEKEGFAMVVPFWAVWAFERIVPGKRHIAGTLNARPSASPVQAACTVSVAHNVHNSTPAIALESACGPLK